MPTENLTLPHQLSRFFVLGCASAIIDVGSLVILVEWVHLHYLLATAISFLLANTFNYIISRKWVFCAGKYSPAYEYTSFLAASGIGLSIHQVVMLILVDHGRLDYRLSNVICIAIVTSWSFLSRKYLIFARNDVPASGF
jgi:putative flippase GtrA